ncbi:MAG: maltose/glucose-specific PTS transporter subunit IIBC [Culicoidibacterales bacterium]
MKQKFWEFFQGLGKTFMLPVSLLAFMGILLGVGSSFTSDPTIELLPFLGNPILQTFFSFISTLGAFAFTYLPIMFAIAIPLGLARQEKGVAAFSGFVGYMVMHMITNFYLRESMQLAPPEMMKHSGQAMILGIQSLDTGVLGGIIIGIITAQLHMKFYTIKLPDSLSFFGGPRFVPIITSVCAAIVGLMIPFIWPIFAGLINSVGNVILGAGPFGPFVFGAGERLLLPFGLHHILVAMIRFTEAGGTEEVCAVPISGALNIYYAQLECGTPFSPTATQFLSQGKMPSFLFGLPAAALAMYHTVDEKRRHLVKGMLISGVIACVVAGITEPIEFLFLFISPVLYGIHAVLTGLGFMVMGLLQVTIGNTDGNIIDFIVFGILQGTATKWYLVPVVGVVWFALYYFIFKFVILTWNLPIIGRESDDFLEGEDQGIVVKLEISDQAHNLITALGGRQNIEVIDNCITRLRMVLKDTAIIDEKALKKNGAIGVMVLDKTNIQVIIGPQVASVRLEMEKQL